MNPDHERFLNLTRLPATIDAEQAAILLGVASAGIMVLVANKFLKPLGRNLAANAPRRFASVTIEGLARDPEQLDRMQRILTQHWRSRNKAKNAESP